ncbi:MULTISPECIES: hypothetical protein [unclassified Mesorhizobium]|uniref:hypothetical protein n=1 Tax=unclassified Mesorhizobium TaxID=325217 RepID=UPI00143F31B9|nr:MULTISPECIES: hypothetical protein [unclassified Mesorhizobium]
MAMNSAACSVETSLEFMAPSVVTGLPARGPAPPTMTAGTLNPEKPGAWFRFPAHFRLLVSVPVCVNIADGLYPHHAA